MFWSRDFVDDWNDEHSPRKQLFPDPPPAKTAKATKPTTSPEKMMATTAAKLAREAKKTFEQAKHDLAAAFLSELDNTITAGQLATLAASTGGIRINWSNKLNTTAGRANWKRETVRTVKTSNAAAAAGRPPETVAVTHKHHASIELAEKVIDDEHRLLNVIAHEFCHLANFMVSGVTTNPHGKEFKAWAVKVSRVFGGRGIEVTTKHSYDIDFKYVWECASCGMEYKRHSKSVHPERHRCGGCKGELKQTKPAPRGKAAGTGAGAGEGQKAGGGTKKAPSEYQLFMKEEMKRVREENPGSPQKDIMKLVASMWSQRQRARTPTPTLEKEIGGLTRGVEGLRVARD